MSCYQFEVDDAKKYGVEEAIILWHIKFWVAKNIANKRHNKDGKTWTYSSLRAFSEIFPFWGKYKVRRIIHSLAEKGAIVIGRFNKTGYDRTKWYAIADESMLRNCNIEVAESQHRRGESATPIPDITTDNNKTYSKEFISSIISSWCNKTGGLLPFNVVGKSLKKIVAMYGEEKVLDGWRRHVEEAGSYRSLSFFVREAGRWCEPEKYSPKKSGKSVYDPI